MGETPEGAKMGARVQQGMKYGGGRAARVDFGVILCKRIYNF
jgi:hypothetical protein